MRQTSTVFEDPAAIWKEGRGSREPFRLNSAALPAASASDRCGVQSSTAGCAFQQRSGLREGHRVKPATSERRALKLNVVCPGVDQSRSRSISTQSLAVASSIRLPLHVARIRLRRAASGAPRGPLSGTRTRSLTGGWAWVPHPFNEIPNPVHARLLAVEVPG